MVGNCVVQLLKGARDMDGHSHKIQLLAHLEGRGRNKQWIRAHLDYPHQDWCLIWPFARAEGKTVQFGKKNINLPRFMCEWRNGPPPTPKHQAAHSCGRGHEGCMNQLHLRWKTNSENQLERYQHSGPVKRAKLTAPQVEEIKSLNGQAHRFAVARQFGVSEVTIRSIWNGTLWNNTGTLTHRFLTEDQVRAIRATPWQTKTSRQFATEFGSTLSAVQHVREGKTYKWVKQ